MKVKDQDSAVTAPPEAPPERSTRSIYIAMIGLILAFFLGGFTWRGRLSFLLLLILGGVGVRGLIRKVRFDGAMVPSDIEWIWQAPRAARFDPSPTSGNPAATFLAAYARTHARE